MKNIFKKIVNLSESRIKEFEENKGMHGGFYRWHKTYIEWVECELKEACDEIRKNNSVYLEDELWDVFWDYICLLNSLKEEGYIESVENVFKRCDKKFGERIPFVRENKNEWAWWEIKKIQKQELKEEHNNKYN